MSPSNISTPEFLADQARQIAKAGRLALKIMKDRDITAERMRLLEAVARGSERRPIFVHMTYRPKGRAKAKIALIGKGVTFDTGGLDLKPARLMETMWADMSGAAAVLATMRVVSEFKPNLIVEAFMPITESVIGSRVMKPGDVIRSRAGKTVEILNTDAEGRLILVDAIDYALDFKPDLIIDLATLTTVVNALGDRYTAILGNHQPLIDRLLKASRAAGEATWPLPLEEAYRPELKSDIADLQNLTQGGGATIKAALFLSEFVKGCPWAHLDIAESSWKDKRTEINGCAIKGATGAGIRTLVEFLMGY